VPAQPVATIPTAVDIRSGICDGAAFNLDGDLFDVQIANHEIELTISYIHNFGFLCNLSIFTDRFSLGLLPAGTYTLRTYSISTFTSFPPPPGSRTLLFTQNFAVSGAAPVSVPSGGAISRLIMAVLLMALGMLAIVRPSNRSTS